MKYQSELINEILEDRGHKKSSLHYESECVEPWIEETKGAYPKLCDYEGEWLNYMVENPIGSFPYETITSNPTATVSNVVPYEYKSAILTGQTLVNIYDIKSSTAATANIEIDGNTCTFKGVGGWVAINNKLPMLKPSTTYTLIVNIITNTLEYSGTNNDYALLLEGVSNNTGFSNGCKIPRGSIGTFKTTLTTKSQFTTNNLSDVRISPTAISGIIKFTYMIIEGDCTNTDTPYFEGMQSVKMPVLTTTGKNLFDKTKIIDNKYQNCNISTGVFTIVTNQNYMITDYIEVSPNTTYTKTNFNNDGAYYDQNKQVIKTDRIASSTFTTPSNAHYIVLNFQKGVDNPENAQLELNSSQTSYEPYKSNILTVNEEVELCGIGDVKDELDLLTGELTQRIGEVVLDGSESWGLANWDSENHLSFIYYFGSRIIGDINKGISDKLPFQTWNDLNTKDIQGFTYGNVGNNNSYVVFKINKTIVSDLITFKSWLAQNPIKIQYLNYQESVKTVELTATNQDGETLSKIKPIEGTMHIESSGTTIHPTAVLEVPVEAITQNLNSFIEEE